MEDEQLTSKSWFATNRKWAVPVGIIAFFIIVISFLSLPVAGALGFGAALTDKELYAGAVKIANTDDEALQVYGTISDIDKLAILESDVNYEKNQQFVKLTVRVSGSKRKGKMDVEAERDGKGWKYTSLRLRSKNPEETVLIINK